MPEETENEGIEVSREEEGKGVSLLLDILTLEGFGFRCGGLLLAC